MRHSYGNINANGTKKSGSGDWTVVKDSGSKGGYTIIFEPPFKTMPTVVTDQNYPGWSDFNKSGGDSRDNTVIIALSNEKCKLKTGDSHGNGQDRNFTFIAIGEQ